MVRAIIPFIFWPWFLVSCGILLRRRFTVGSWRPSGPSQAPPPIEFPSPPESAPESAADIPIDRRPAADLEDIPFDRPPADTGPVIAPPPSRAPSKTLAEALAGIALPCDLAPLMGSGLLDPVRAAFFTTGFAPSTVGSALSDELERLGFVLTPEDEQSIRARRGDDAIRARLVSAMLSGGLVMSELHPSAPEDALVVELQLV